MHSPIHFLEGALGLNYILPIEVALVHQKIVARVTKVLEENKGGPSNVMLATKHMLLTTTHYKKTGVL